MKRITLFVVSFIVVAYLVLRYLNRIPSFKVLSVDWENETVTVEVNGETYSLQKDGMSGVSGLSNGYSLELGGVQDMNYSVFLQKGGSRHGDSTHINFIEREITHH